MHQPISAGSRSKRDNVITVNEFLFDFHYFPEDDFLPLLVVGTVECALWRMDCNSFGAMDKGIACGYF